MMSPSSLPYSDTKPVGAADFSFTINATFRFIRKKLGEDALRNYGRDLGSQYLAPVSRLWLEGGLDAVAAYWRDFFAAEPGSEVIVSREDKKVVLDVRVCPAIRHLRSGARPIDPGFCQHCYFASGRRRLPRRPPAQSLRTMLVGVPPLLRPRPAVAFYPPRPTNPHLPQA